MNWSDWLMIALLSIWFGMCFMVGMSNLGEAIGKAIFIALQQSTGEKNGSSANKS